MDGHTGKSRVVAARALLPLAMGMMAGCATPPDRQPRAELALFRAPDASAVVIELRNTGAVPIKVDGKLMLLTSIAFLDANGSTVRWEEADSLPRPDRFADRFVTLAPGQKVTRAVDPGRAFPTFIWGWGTVLGDEGSYHIPNAYETMVRLPAGAKPAAVEVSYDRGGFMYDDNIRFYTGSTLAELGLYEGPLKQRITLGR